MRVIRRTITVLILGWLVISLSPYGAVVELPMAWGDDGGGDD
jgi:hypothetical protein